MQASDWEENGLVALTRELQSSLYLIARHAELNASDSIDIISKAAEGALALIDSYQLAAQVERGQLRLDLMPVAVGSILHDSKYELLRILPIEQPVLISANAHLPVMTHPQTLRAMLVASAMSLSQIAQSVNKPIQFRSYTTTKGEPSVGVFVEGAKLTISDLRRALEDQSEMRMKLPKHTSRSGVALSIADTLCSTVGGKLTVRSIGSFSGLATTLPKSEQMALV